MIIDPQVDFITGSLSIEGAESAMDSLAQYVERHGKNYCDIVVTADSHPASHCSFKENGGEWQRHCVKGSNGAAIWSPLFKVLFDGGREPHLLHKGQFPDVEEYSIFSNRSAADYLKDLFSLRQVDSVDICGLAGDVCVLQSLNDGMKMFPDISFNVLWEYSPCIDQGAVENIRHSDPATH